MERDPRVQGEMSPPPVGGPGGGRGRADGAEHRVVPGGITGCLSTAGSPELSLPWPSDRVATPPIPQKQQVQHVPRASPVRSPSPERRPELQAARRTPHRRGLPGARSTIGLLLAASLALAGVGANAAQAETPAQKIARLRRTARRLAAARKQLAGSEQVMGERIRAIYIDGPVTRLGQLLEVQTVSDAVTMAHYQQSVTDADVESIANVEQSKRELTSISDTLASQQRQQEDIQAMLSSQRRDIEHRLAQQRDYLDRLSGEVKQAVQAEQRRQEELRRQALERKLAAERAAQLKA